MAFTLSLFGAVLAASPLPASRDDALSAARRDARVLAAYAGLLAFRADESAHAWPVRLSARAAFDQASSGADGLNLRAALSLDPLLRAGDEHDLAALKTRVAEANLAATVARAQLEEVRDWHARRRALVAPPLASGVCPVDDNRPLPNELLSWTPLPALEPDLSARPDVLAARRDLLAARLSRDALTRDAWPNLRVSGSISGTAGSLALSLTPDLAGTLTYRLTHFPASSIADTVWRVGLAADWAPDFALPDRQAAADALIVARRAALDASLKSAAADWAYAHAEADAAREALDGLPSPAPACRLAAAQAALDAALLAERVAVAAPLPSSPGA